MPTFFEGLKRMITGQPVFKPGEDEDGVELKDAQDTPDTTQPAQQSTLERTGPKVIPLAIIEHIECRTNGSNMDVSIHVKNHSQGDIMLDKISLFGDSREIDHTLRPGEMREFPVFSGARPSNRNYTHCELHYRDEPGDYFSAAHNVEFEQEPDGTYTVNRIRFIPPVKDI